MIKLKDLIIEGWNSNLWKSDLWNSHLWNSNIEKSDIWNPGMSSHHSSDEAPDSDFGELNEIMFSNNFWVLPNGEIKKVNDHVSWILCNVHQNKIRVDDDEMPTKEDGSIAEEEDVYDVAFELGYLRMVKPYEDDMPLIVDYSPDRPPTNLQWRNIKDFAIENGWKLSDRVERIPVEL